MFEKDRLILAQQRIHGLSGSIAGLDSSLTAKEGRAQTAQQIHQSFCPKKSVLHWKRKLLVDTDESTQLVDRIAVLLASAEDGSTKLLGVP